MKTINHCLIAERIRLERKKKNLTQAQLAEQTGFTTNYIGCIECGSKPGSFNAYFKIVEALGIGFDTILADVLEPKENTEEFAILRIFRQLKDADQKLAQKVLEEILKAHS